MCDLKWNSEKFRPNIRHRHDCVAFEDESNILLKVIEWYPPDPVGNLSDFRWLKYVVIEPENDIMSPAQLNLPNVNMQYILIGVLLYFADYEFAASPKQYGIFLHLHFGLISNKALDFASLRGKDMEPNISLILVVVETIAFDRWDYVLESEDLTRLVVVFLTLIVDARFATALTLERSNEAQGPINPPYNLQEILFSILVYFWIFRVFPVN